MPRTSSSRFIVIISILIAFAGFGILNTKFTAKAGAKASDPDSAILPEGAANRIEQAAAQTGVYFEENRGQQNGRVRYMTRGGGHTVFLTSTEAVFVLMHPEADGRQETEDRSTATPLSFDPRRMRPDERIELQEPRMGTALYMTLAGANQNANFVPDDQLEHRTNYFRGSDPNRWQTEIPNYRQITENNIYDGVDIAWRGKQDGSMQYDFIVAPNADPSQIEWRIDGADNVSIDADGNLLIDTGAGRMIQQKPFTFQGAGEDKAEVASNFVIRPTPHSFSVGFNIGGYDRSRPLVIDPSVNLSNLSFSTYLGGSTDEQGKDIAVAPSGNVFVTGRTLSANFPTTAGVFSTTNAGGYDVFVTKLNASGSALVYSTYLGGSGDDYGEDIAVDPSGNAFVTGYTSSTIFPTTAGALSTTNAGGNDVFVTKLNASGSALVYSTFIGGSNEDYGLSIAIDPSGNAFAIGRTSSTNLPTTAGAFSQTYMGGTDSFVIKLNTSGSALVYSTYLGGTNFEEGEGVAVDTLGNAFVTGYTLSSNFPTTAGAFRTTNAGSYDVFVTMLNASGSALVYSTYLGGISNDFSYGGIAIDPSGNAYVSGYTSSTNFPTTAGAFRTTNAGSNDVFVTKLNASGSALVYSTYLGGNSVDNGRGFTIDSSGNAFVTGETTSTNFPTTAGAFSTTYTGNTDVFVTELNASGSALVYSTYIGGSNYDEGTGIAVDTSGNVFVTGYTSATNFPTTAGAFSTTFTGFNDAFVTKLGDFSILGTVTYGNAAAPPKYISNAMVTGTGSPNVFTTTAAPGGTAGQYSLTGFGAGSYTVSLAKTTGQNSITSNDAARIAQHVAGTLLLTNNNQKVAADVTGNNAISSQDAAKIAQVVAGQPLSPPNFTGQWRFFLPPGPTFPVGASATSRTYSSVTSNITGDDYVGLLIGEVTGNWTPSAARTAGGSAAVPPYLRRSSASPGSSDQTSVAMPPAAEPQDSNRQASEKHSFSANRTAEPWTESVGSRRLAVGNGPERGIAVELANIAASVGKEVIVPVNVRGVADKNVISYEFNLRYDPAVIQPLADPVELKDSVSRGLSVVTNASEPGFLRVVVYGALPINGDGVLLNLRFAAVGAAGSVSPISFERVMFNEGEPRVTVLGGRIELF